MPLAVLSSHHVDKVLPNLRSNIWSSAARHIMCLFAARSSRRGSSSRLLSITAGPQSVAACTDQMSPRTAATKSNSAIRNDTVAALAGTAHFGLVPVDDIL